MAFNSARTDDIQPVGSGERIGDSHIILTATTFEDGLNVGRFAKLDSGSLDNVDSSASPVIAGVVLRHVSRSVESGGTVDASLQTNVEYGRWGLFTVDVVDGDTPSRFGQVYVHNLDDADAGKATTTDSADTESVNAEFIHEVQSGVWLIAANLIAQ